MAGLPLTGSSAAGEGGGQRGEDAQSGADRECNKLFQNFQVFPWIHGVCWCFLLRKALLAGVTQYVYLCIGGDAVGMGGVGVYMSVHPRSAGADTSAPFYGR